MNFISRLYNSFFEEISRQKDIAQWKTHLRKNGFPVYQKYPKEKEYILFWKQFSSRVEPFSFRFYSHYMDNVSYIIPEDIGHRVIENSLNPKRFRDFYNDKNLYDQLFTSEINTPNVILRRIGGSSLLGKDYKIPFLHGQKITYESSESDLSDFIGEKYDSVVLKPSLDSKGGQGIRIFIRKDNIFVDSKNSDILSGSFLKDYGNDFNIQETLQQHPFFAQFNPTSVNTLRMCTYRSVADEEIVLFACALRMGSKGAVTDNTHSGGAIVGVDLKTGKIQNTVYGKYRMPFKKWNDIDFESYDGNVPNWGKTVSFAQKIASQIHHMRLLSLDITVRSDGEPILIELNANGFSFGLPMCLNQPVFGDRFDEVIEYCKK